LYLPNGIKKAIGDDLESCLLENFKDFASCHAAKMREGLSAAAADRYCGALQQQIEGGSSQYAAAPSNPQMSEQMPQKEKDDGGGNVTLTMQEAEALANAVFNDDLEKAKSILKSVMNIQEETSPAPPAV
jgi:hypothetical protein